MRRLALSLVLSTFVIAACSEPTPPRDSETEFSLRATRPVTKTRSITVTPSSDTIQVGQTTQLTASTKPASAFVAWLSLDSAIAAVSQTGLVTGVAAGITQIVASSATKADSATIRVISTSPSDSSVTFVGAGDIASCDSIGTGHVATAALLDSILGTVFTLGDNVYPNGTAQEFTNCYNPTWGRHKARTKPSPGNHDYNTAGAAGYFGYFGSAVGDSLTPYYSYNIGTWHIIVLNSNVARDSASAQLTWLRNDLAASTRSCTLAYWHHPRFSSGSGHGNDSTVAAFWDALYVANADVILGGHDHDYERFAPQTPTGVADASRGIREFVVGTGGRSHYTLGTLKVNSQVFDGATYGVLKLTLSAGGYSWQFIPVAGATFTDSGSGTCH
jgi:hypothetical protein